MSDRPYTEADVEWLAELLTGHHQTRGMAVTMGVTCDCGYWTGSEPLDQPRGHRPLPWGRDRLDLHRARAVLDALTAAGWAPRDTNRRDAAPLGRRGPPYPQREVRHLTTREPT